MSVNSITNFGACQNLWARSSVGSKYLIRLEIKIQDIEDSTLFLGQYINLGTFLGTYLNGEQ